MVIVIICLRCLFPKVGPKSALELEQSIQNHISLNPFSPCFVQVRVLDGCFHYSVLAFPNTHRV